MCNTTQSDVALQSTLLTAEVKKTTTTTTTTIESAYSHSIQSSEAPVVQHAQPRRPLFGHLLNACFLRKRFLILPRVRSIGFGGLELSGWEFVLLLFYLLCNVGVFFVTRYMLTSGKHKTTNLLARYFGHYISLHLGLTLLPVTRNSIWVRSIGASFERVIKYHRWVARMTFILMGAHFICWIRSWIIKKVVLVKPFQRMQLYGEIIFLCVLIMLVLSLGAVRRQQWDVFFWSHILFIPVIVLSILHSLAAQTWREDVTLYYCAPGILLYIIDRIVRFYRGIVPAKVLSLDTSVEGITRVEIYKKSFKFSPGQYVFVNFPKVSLVEWHPFTISSDPAVRSRFTLNIKDMGEYTWTHRLYKHAQERDTTLVRVDGPYGNLGIDFEEASVVAIFCGGIGVTPGTAILSYLNHRFAASLLPAIQKVHFYWATRRMDMQNMFADTFAAITNGSAASRFELNFFTTTTTKTTTSKSNTAKTTTTTTSSSSDLAAADVEAGDAAAAAAAALFSSSTAKKNRVGQQQQQQQEESSPLLAASNASSSRTSSSSMVSTINHFVGRPDIGAALSELRERYKGTTTTRRVSVFVCGPAEMVDDVSDKCRQMSSRSFFFDFVYSL